MFTAPDSPTCLPVPWGGVYFPHLTDPVLIVHLKSSTKINRSASEHPVRHTDTLFNRIAPGRFDLSQQTCGQRAVPRLSEPLLVRSLSATTFALTMANHGTAQFTVMTPGLVPFSPRWRRCSPIALSDSIDGLATPLWKQNRYSDY